MSDLKSQAKQFKIHWVDVVWLLKEDGEDIQDYENEIRENWHDDAYRLSVCLWAAERSQFRQELIAMSRGIAERMKNVAAAN